jgi:hypothetical protein
LMPRRSMSRTAVTTGQAPCWARHTRRFTKSFSRSFLVMRLPPDGRRCCVVTLREFRAAEAHPAARSSREDQLQGSLAKKPLNVRSPKRKRTNSRWPSMGINYPANRPDPDGPGGLGAEESGAERTGPTQDCLFATRKGGRRAEVGRYYDSANVPVTLALFPAVEMSCGRSAREAGTAPLAEQVSRRDHVVGVTGGRT